MSGQRPTLFLLLSAVLVVVAMSLPIQAFVIYEHPLAEWAQALGKLTSLNWVVFVGTLLAAFSIYRVSAFCPWVMLTLTVLVGLNNFVVGYAAIDYSPEVAWLGTLVFSLLNIPLWLESTRALMIQPELRIWSQAERRRMQVPIVIDVFRKTPLKAETFDLSETGAFIPLSSANLRVDENISVRMTFGAFTHIRCEGRVVRRDEARGRYPAGVGIEFTNLNWRNRRELRRHLRF